MLRLGRDRGGAGEAGRGGGGEEGGRGVGLVGGGRGAGVVGGAGRGGGREKSFCLGERDVCREEREVERGGGEEGKEMGLWVVERRGGEEVEAGEMGGRGAGPRRAGGRGEVGGRGEGGGGEEILAGRGEGRRAGGEAGLGGVGLTEVEAFLKEGTGERGGRGEED